MNGLRRGHRIVYNHILLYLQIDLYIYNELPAYQRTCEQVNGEIEKIITIKTNLKISNWNIKKYPNGLISDF